MTWLRLWLLLLVIYWSHSVLTQGQEQLEPRQQNALTSVFNDLGSSLFPNLCQNDANNILLFHFRICHFGQDAA